MFFSFSNINEAFRELVNCFHNRDIKISVDKSRNGTTLRAATPVTIQFRNPTHRVLFNQVRDCNPFFHIYESFWMLAGRNDVESVSYFASKMGQYSDDGTTFWGAYGHRWRGWFGGDQIWSVINELRTNPNSRRAVLQMWDGQNDLNKATSGGLDVPCNLCCVFSIRDDLTARCLDMTVMNRSNDLVWGLCGANVVHMSYLLEYVASNLGVEVGHQYHVSNNLHIYTETNSRFNPKDWGKYVSHDQNFYLQNEPMRLNEGGPISTAAICTIADNVDGEFKTDCLYADTVVRPMLKAFAAHKERNYDDALAHCQDINSKDWKYVSEAWITKRRDNYISRQNGESND